MHGAPGLPTGPYVPDGVAGEYCLFGRHADPLQGQLDQVWADLLDSTSPGESAALIASSASRAARSVCNPGSLAELASTTAGPRCLRRPQQVRGARQLDRDINDVRVDHHAVEGRPGGNDAPLRSLPTLGTPVAGAISAHGSYVSLQRVTAGRARSGSAVGSSAASRA